MHYFSLLSTKYSSRVYFIRHVGSHFIINKHNIPLEKYPPKKHISSHFCGVISHMLLNITVYTVINSFLFHFSNTLKFHDRTNFIRLTPDHIFFFADPDAANFLLGTSYFHSFSVKYTIITYQCYTRQITPYPWSCHAIL